MAHHGGPTAGAAGAIGEGRTETRAKHALGKELLLVGFIVRQGGIHLPEQRTLPFRDVGCDDRLQMREEGEYKPERL